MSQVTRVDFNYKDIEGWLQDPFVLDKKEAFYNHRNEILNGVLHDRKIYRWDITSGGYFFLPIRLAAKIFEDNDLPSLSMSSSDFKKGRTETLDKVYKGEVCLYILRGGEQNAVMVRQDVAFEILAKKIKQAREENLNQRLQTIIRSIGSDIISGKILVEIRPDDSIHIVSNSVASPPVIFEL